jgi:hypothetical protein
MSENTHYTPENAKTWRDLTDQLTPEQIAELEDREKYHRVNAASLPAGYPYEWPPRSESEIADLLLLLARGHARDNLVAAMVGEVPLPASVEKPADLCAYAWEEHDPLPYRVIFGSRRVIPSRDDEDVEIKTSVIQFSDGRVDDGDVEGPAVRINGVTYTGQQARRFAASVIDAADELDRLATR